MKRSARFIVFNLIIAAAIILTVLITGPLNISLPGQQKLNPDSIRQISCYQTYVDEAKGTLNTERITVYSDNRMTREHLYAVPAGMDGSPSVPPDTSEEYTISNEDFGLMIQTFNNYEFLKIPDDCSDPEVRDGGDFYIELITDKETYRKGGYHPTDDRFVRCFYFPEYFLD